MAVVGKPFDLQQDAAYQAWRAHKLACQPVDVHDLIVPVQDPRALSASERSALLQRVAQCNMAVYRSTFTGEDTQLVAALGQQLGLHRLDANWLADEDGISHIAVSDADQGSRTDFIPYTDRAIRWHTDGYYHPPERRIRAMVLHCVRSAREGGVNGLIDHEMAYMALRDTNPAWVQALMAPDAMTIPERVDAQGVARAAQSGPVFSVLSAPGGGQALHMRYTARTRSIAWRDDPLTQDAVAFLARLLDGALSWRYHLRMEPGMGIVANNVLHDRSGFVDDPNAPRLLYRARYLDAVAPPP